ncbi:unnamed protein product, partial [Sphacelaria rigidula]
VSLAHTGKTGSTHNSERVACRVGGWSGDEGAENAVSRPRGPCNTRERTETKKRGCSLDPARAASRSAPAVNHVERSEIVSDSISAENIRPGQRADYRVGFFCFFSSTGYFFFVLLRGPVLACCAPALRVSADDARVAAKKQPHSSQPARTPPPPPPASPDLVRGSYLDRGWRVMRGIATTN